MVVYGNLPPHSKVPEIEAKYPCIVLVEALVARDNTVHESVMVWATEACHGRHKPAVT